MTSVDLCAGEFLCPEAVHGLRPDKGHSKEGAEGSADDGKIDFKEDGGCPALTCTRVSVQIIEG